MIYLDNAATTFPKPPCMIKAMTECITNYCGNPGRSGHKMSMVTGEKIFHARNEIAKLFNIDDPSRVIFTSNATESLNLGIKGILDSGDHVITTSMEHNSVLRPLKKLESKEITSTIINCDKDGYLDINEIEMAITRYTKLIVCTHASNVTGTIMPIHEICKIAKKHGIFVLLDVSQSAGCLDINVKELGVDMIALPGHKGLLGPLGTGILYVRKGITLKHLKEGGTGTFSQNLYQPYDYPEGYESGTINAPGIIGLGASVKFLQATGIGEIERHERYLTYILDEKLRNMDNIKVYGPENIEDKTGIVLFNIENMDCEEVSSLLSDDYNIASRAGFHCAPLAHSSIGTGEIGAVRISVGPFSKEEEIRKTIDAIYKIAK